MLLQGSSNYSCWARKIVPCATLFVFVAFTGAPAARAPSPAYDQPLDALAAADSEQQFETLRGFLTQPPSEERAFLKLLEKYLSLNQSAEAQNFFTELALRPQFSRNSSWMLAKLAALDTLPQNRAAALAAFSQALHDSLTPPSTALLFDFVEFLHQQFDRPQAALRLAKTALRPAHRELAAAFHHYQNGEYAQASLKFRALSQQIPLDALLLYIWSASSQNNEQIKLAERLAQADSLCRLGLALQNSDRALQARFWAKRGDLAFIRDDYARAAERYRFADSLARSSDDIYSRQKTLAGFAKLSYMQHDFAAAAAFYEEAIARAETIRAYRDLCTLYSNYGHLLYEEARYDEALQASLQGEKYAARLRDQKSAIALQIASARVYHALAQSVFAKKICEGAHGLAQRYHYAVLQNRAEQLLAEIAVSEGRLEEARALCYRIIPFLRRNNRSSDCHNFFALLADTYHAAAAYDSAVALYHKAGEEALAEKNSFYHIWYLLETADLESKRRDYARALQILAAVHPLVREENHPGLLTRLHLSLGLAYQKLEAWEQALAAYRAAAAVIDSARQELRVEELRIGYFSERTRAYQGLAECLLRRYQKTKRDADLDSLFYCVQITKGRSFYDRAKGETSSINRLLETPGARNYRRARETLQRLQRRLRQSPQEREKLRPKLETARYAVIAQRLRLREPDLAQAAPLRENVPSLAEAKKMLRRFDAGLLLYHISQEAAFVFALAGDEVRLVELPATQTQIASAVDSLMRPFHQLQRDALSRIPYRADAAYQLYQALLAPVAAAMGRALPQKLVVVPDFVLMNLSFEMLLVNSPKRPVYVPSDAPSYAKDFLAQRHTLVNCPTLACLQNTARAQNSSVSMLVLANPFARAAAPQIPAMFPGSRASFMPLAFTGAEAKRIQQAHPSARLRTREQATQAALGKGATTARVLHFATHAFVDPEFDAFSGLILAMSDSADDGILMGYEIADLELRADLVTLSACETGLGNLAEGEGVLGLPRLFLRAGANSVLMTLWQVHDKFAAELMPQFYDLYLNQNFSKADALAQAKRALLQEPKMENGGIYYQHPFFWATFAFYGDPGWRQAGLARAVKITLFAFVILLLGPAAYFLYAKRIVKPFSAQKNIR